MANTTLQIGIVSTTRGEVFARGLDGQMRRLAVGDPLYQGDVIVTANGSAVDVMPLDGQPFSVGEQQTVAVDMQVAPVETPVTLEAAKAPVAVNPAAGFDLNALLEDEAAAAGLTGGDAESGHSFVDLARIVEVVPTVGYDFPVTPTGSPPEIRGLGGGESAEAGSEEWALGAGCFWRSS